jgi:hypothetical protein
MPLNKPQLQTNILSLLDNSFAETENSTQARQNFANELGNLIDAYVKSATYTIPPGAIIVTGSAATQTNPNPIVLNNVIS